MIKQGTYGLISVIVLGLCSPISSIERTSIPSNTIKAPTLPKPILKKI